MCLHLYTFICTVYYTANVCIQIAGVAQFLFYDHNYIVYYEL